ncbi:MAG: putative pyridoxine/pyridoxamine 5-phosphate oxidase [Ilumatobacteraceae bacterium]|nr:putative pyridoxine/pyridoxamine 5-phosphate oxidase [Ilumatobacteraceae bacterium]
MDLNTAIDFVRARRQGVLTTLRRDGRPQLSNIIYAVDEAGLIRISITAERAKYPNLLRQPWAALHVTQDDFWAYVVVEADAELAPVAKALDDPTVEELIALYRHIAGEHRDWDAYRAAMVTEQRTIVRLTPTRAYGMLRLPSAT